MSVQLALCLRHLPEMLGWAILPAVMALAIPSVRQRWLRKCLLGSAWVLGSVWSFSLILAIFGWSSFWNGLGQWIFMMAYLCPLLLTVGFTLAALVLVPFPRFRSLWRPAGVGILSFFTAHLAYPVSVAAYCDYSNRHRADPWRWVHMEDAILLVDRTRPADSGFAGIIQIYPPVFSLPPF